MNELPATREQPTGTVAAALERLAIRLPGTREAPAADPAARARAIARSAALRAAALSGGLALPPGPLGLLTVLPDLIALWRIQAQMVADIAGAHGRHATLTRSHMIYCLFKHAAGQAVKDLVVRAGERLVTRPVTGTVTRHVGAALGRRALGGSLSRWIPVAGAVGVGLYAYYDTLKVAESALEMLAAEG